MARSGDPLLAAKDLAVSRGGLPVLEDVSLTLWPGQVIALRGPNGIGKTTLLRTLAGLQRPEAGRIAKDDDVVAYAGHVDGVKPTLTVRETLAFWARAFGHRDIDAAMVAFDLTPLARRQGGALSAGQRRRLGLARLMVTGRPVWALDEPTVSLDAESVGRFAAVIRAHCDAGGAAVIATHADLGLPTETLDLSPHRAALPDLVEADAWAP